MKKKITIQGTASEIDISSQTSMAISFYLGDTSYSFEVVHRFNNRKMVLRSVDSHQHHIVSVGIPTKNGTSTVQLSDNDITIRPITRNAQASQNIGDLGPNAIAPLSGIIRAIKVKMGDAITEGTTLAVIEAMKMQMPIEAQLGGTVTAIHVKENEEVREGALLVEISN
jgi:biotin carboxyl carrier protein